MRQVCYVCGIVYGYKEPYDYQMDTHGLCKDCFEKELEKLNAFKSVCDGRHPNDPDPEEAK